MSGRTNGAPTTAMILAAGRGERMRPLTDTVPKPLLAVRGKPLIEQHVERLAAVGITRVVVNLAWLGQQIREYLGSGARYGVDIHYSDEAPRALETAGGIVRALPWLGAEPFLVVNGDVFTDYPFERLRMAEDHDAQLVLVPNPPHHPRGDFLLAGGLALPLPEPAPAPSASLTFAGIALYRPVFFAGCGEGALPLKPLLLRAMAAARCGGEFYGGLWEDVGTPARLAALNTE